MIKGIAIKTWYVYKITFEDFTFYIGYRCTRNSIEEDFLKKYFSSSKAVKEKITAGVKFAGEIIGKFDNQTIAYDAEQLLIFENFESELILNRACYFGRKGFGILSEAAKKIIGDKSAALWKNEEYRKNLEIKRKEHWTEEKRMQQSIRLSGVKRPEHSEIMKSKHTHLPADHYFRAKTKSESHKQHISDALTGKPKSEEHKQKLKKPKPKALCPCCGKTIVPGTMRFHKKCNLPEDFTLLDDTNICLKLF